MAMGEEQVRVPLGRNAFIGGDNFDTLYGLFTREDARMPSLIILTGMSGVGKTETGLQFLKKYSDDRPEKECKQFIIASCKTPNALSASLRQLANRFELHLPAFNEKPTNELREIFRQLFAKINEKYPEDAKLFLFDDAELKSSLLHHIDSAFCKELLTGNHDHRLWKIVVTIQEGTVHNARKQWIERCDYINDTHFNPVEKFNTEQSKEYIDDLELSEEEKEKLIDRMSGLPLALKVAKQTLNDNELGVEGYLDSYLSSLDDIKAPNAAIAAIQLSVNRLIEYAETPEIANVMRQVIKMISLLDEKMIASDIVISCAEVALVAANGQVNGQTQAARLANSIIGGLKHRSLCETCREEEPVVTVNLYQLVRQSLSHYRIDDSDDETRKLIRMTLVALTRLMPKDGRSHHPHTLLSYMHKHGETLEAEIRELKDKGKLNRDNSPCIMILFSNLLSCMAYCQLAQRNPYKDDVKPLIDAALDEYSMVLTGQWYRNLRPEADDDTRNLTESEKKAYVLIKAARSADVIQKIIENEAYGAFIHHLSRYHRLTKKDMLNMLPWEKPEKVKRELFKFLENGHLNEACFNKLTQKNLVISAVLQGRIYVLEILAEIYDVQARVYGSLQEDELLGSSYDGAKAGLYVCRSVKEQTQIPLLLGAIIERDNLLKMELETGDRPPDEVKADYERLRDLTEQCYEYGLLKSDMSQDKYHRFICDEGIASCKGHSFSRTRSPQDYEDGKALFSQLIDDSKQFDSAQTQSKTHKKLAEFENRCGYYSEAVKQTLWAMYYLNEFLRKGAAHPSFPEQQPKCGKFKALYKLLQEYYHLWKRDNDELSTMLKRSSEDLLIKYVENFTSHYNQNYSPNNQADAENPFQIIEDLIPKPEDVAMEVNPPANAPQDAQQPLIVRDVHPQQATN